MKATFQQPPKGKSIFHQLRLGKTCQRTGHLGCASISWQGTDFVVTRMHPRVKQWRFDDYWPAIKHFNAIVGKTKLQLKDTVHAQ